MNDSYDILSMIRPHLLDVTPYQAVEPPETLAKREGLSEDQIIKLDANENPYGPSPRVQKALANLHKVPIYPDPEQTSIRQALGRYVGIGSEHIVVGNGSDEIIDLLFRSLLSPGAAIIDCSPTFGMYKFTAQVNDIRVIDVPRNTEFQIDLRGVLKAFHEGAQVAFICSPNNPTGNPTELKSIESLLRAGIFVILDQAYQEFASDSDSGINLVEKYENLAVLRTFSKWAGLAGLRVGYGVFSRQLTDLLIRIKPPYSVGQAAEAAAHASLNDVSLLENRVAQLVIERTRMASMLASLPGVRPWPSSANFILCQLPPSRGKMVYEALARSGIFVRYFSHRRLRDCVRISVGLPSDTDRLINTMSNILKDLG